MKSLSELAIELGTDKGPQGHAYTEYYDMFFSEFRGRAIHIVELGIWEGASLRMWDAYFSKALITGVDIDEKEQYRTGKIHTMVADLKTDIGLKEVFEVIESAPITTIIVDDASHDAMDQISAFDYLFPLLHPGSLYCIEDCLCSFDKERWGEKANVYDRIHKAIDEVNMSGKGSPYQICANKKQEVSKYDLNEFEKNIEWVFNSCGLCIIKKM